MVRKLALALAVVAMILPVGSFALGLGEIRLNSYLNQPLDATIPLLSVDPDEADQIHVGLAPPAEFSRFGIDYRDEWRQLRFAVERRGGQVVVRITSPGPFREPFLDILLEIDWPNGRLLRQYTALVDPPVLIPGGGGPVGTAVVQRPAAPAPAPAPAPVAAPAPAAAPAATAGVGPAVAPGGTYGPVRSNETLWNIARRLRPDATVSVEQMMIALQRANPEAFGHGNINELRAGSVLRVPSPDEVRSIPRSRAVAEARAQYRSWRARIRGEQVPQAATLAAQGPAEGRLELLAPPEGAGAGGETGVAAAGGEGAGELAAQLALAREEVRATREQNEELRSRLAQLEEQVASLERLATLKDEQLASLQQAMAQLRQGAAVGEAAPAAGAAPAVPAEVAMAQGETAAGPAAEAPAGPEAAGAAAEAEAGAESAGPEAPGAELAGEATGKAEEVEEAEEAAPPAAEPAVAGAGPVGRNPYAVEGFRPVSPEEVAAASRAGRPEPTGVVAFATEYLRANPWVAGATGGVVLLLLGLSLLLVRRRREAAEELAAAPAAEPEPPAPELSGLDSEQTALEPAEGSRLSEFAASSVEGLESEISEGDPLTEADVFLAYGRFEPAEALMKEAIEAEPGRIDYKVKLLEVYYAARDREAFEREARKLREEMGEALDPAWNKVAEMGRDLCPDSELFAAAAPAAPAEEDRTLEFDLGELELEGAGDAGSEPIEELTGETSLDLDVAAAAGEQEAEAAPAAGTGETAGDESGRAAAVDDLESSTGEAAGATAETEEAEARTELMREPAGEPLPDLAGREPQDLDTEELELDTREFDWTGPGAGAEEAAAPGEDTEVVGEHELEDIADLETQELDRLTAELEAEDQTLQPTRPMGTETADAGEEEFEWDEQTLSGVLGEDLEEAGPERSDETRLLSRDEAGLAAGSEELGELDDLDLEDLSEELQGEATESLEAADSETAVFSAVDEVSTKLDLARAYIDMGDPDGARSILDEVLDEGDDQQRDEARELIKQIS